MIENEQVKITIPVKIKKTIVISVFIINNAQFPGLFLKHRYLNPIFKPVTHIDIQ